jgi:HEAT repeat protein
MSARTSHSRMVACQMTATILGSVLLFSIAASPGFAIKVPEGMDRCPSLNVCLLLLDNVVPANDDGEGSNAQLLAKDLSRFGNAAKHELLVRAVGNDPGWRNVAGAILSDWPSWDASDVAALRIGLHLDPGGWLARPLGRIGTPEAIEALVEDLPNGEENQTDFALEQLGARAVPYLYPLLKSDQNAASAARVISAMHPLPVSYACDWAATALDPSKKYEDRIATLRGIAALGPSAKPVCLDLRTLLTAPEPGVRREARITLHAIHDPSVVVDLAQQCRPHAEMLDSPAIDAFVCLHDIAVFGPDGREAGRYLLPFLDSKNGAERAYGILTLGLIGYKEASPQIELALKSPDWRIVNAAVSSLGWLGDHEAILPLNTVASSYWLPEVRENAAQTVAAIRSPDGRLDSAVWKVRENGLPRDPFSFVTDGPFQVKLGCKSNLWNWKGQTFKLSRPPGRASSLRFRKDPMFGELVGTDNGEWGGQLAWLPYKGQPESLIRDGNNVVGMEYQSDGSVAAVAYLGLRHLGFDYGFVLEVSVAADGTWNKSEIARLPGEPVAWGTISPGLFAVESNDRVVVFSAKDGILGLAGCAASQ